MQSLTAPTRAALLALLAAMPLCGCKRAANAEGPGIMQEPAAPRVRLRISGMLDGRLEPCGCASGQLGGLARRVFNLRRDKAHDLLIEGGNVVAGGTPLDVQKYATAVMVLDAAGYDVLGIGPEDLELPLQDLLDYLGIAKFTALASNLQPKRPIPDWRGKAFSERQIPSVKGHSVKVRVASLMTTKPEEGAGKAFELLSVEAGWQRAMQGAAAATLRIAILHGSVEEARAATRLDPLPDLVIGVTRAVPEPPHNPDPSNGVPVVFPGIRGRMLLDVTLARIAGKPTLTRYHVIYLRGSETMKGALEDTTTKQMILSHREDVKALGIRELMANRRELPGGRHYLGSESCKTCHASAFEVWRTSKHGHAWQTLEKAQTTRYHWPVTHYPDCVSCHTVGYGDVSGFVNPEKTPQLEGVGCEACHGPGSEHAIKPMKSNILRSSSGDCRRCHDFEQSPSFDYLARWKKIAHTR